jgi:hypothetical protein
MTTCSTKMIREMRDGKSDVGTPSTLVEGLQNIVNQSMSFHQDKDAMINAMKAIARDLLAKVKP